MNAARDAGGGGGALRRGRGLRLGWWSLVLFLGVCLASLPPLLASEWQGTEARRAAITEEMAWSGDRVVPTLGNVPTLAKPPLFYWVSLPFLDASGRLPPWRARLPGTLALAGLAVVALHVGVRLCGPRAGLLAAGSLVTLPWFLTQLGSAEVDTLFSALLGAAILLLVVEASLPTSPWVMVGAGVLLGLALLTKGPPLLMFVVPLFLVKRHGWRPARVLLLVAVALVVALPWLMAVWQRVGFGAFWRTASHESVGRSAEYTLTDVLLLPLHLGAAPLRLLPWGLLLVPLLRRRGADLPPQQRWAVWLPLAALAGAVLALCFFPSRSSRYLAPALGPLALPLGMALDRAVARTDLDAWGARILPWVGIALGVLLLLLAADAPIAQLLPALAARAQTPGFWLLAVPPAVLVCGVLLALPRTWPARLLAVGAVLVIQCCAWSFDLGRREGCLNRAFAPQARALLARIPTEDIALFGHVASQFLIALRPHPRQDEAMAAAPTTRWILFEETDAKPDDVPRMLARRGARCDQRQRLRLGNRSLVLAETRPR